MLIRKPPRIRSSEITPESVYRDRRRFMQAAIASGITATLPQSLEAVVHGPGKLPRIADVVDTPYGAGLKLTAYKDVTGYNNFYEFGTSKTDPAEYSGNFKARPWTVTVDGECEQPGEIGIEDIMSLFPQEERIYRLRCVEAWSMVVPWIGFPLGDLLKRFKPTSNANYVAFETLHDAKRMPGQRRSVLDWPYREGLRIDEAMHPLSILVTGLYGEILPNQNGAPLRLMVPWKYGFKAIKSIVRIRFVRDLPETTWWKSAPHEYGFYANVNPAVDHPRWSQKYHRVIGASIFAPKEKTQAFNGYAEDVAQLYKGMDLRKFF